MRSFKIILFVLMGLVLLVVVAIAALIFVDPTVYRNQIETRASNAFNRQFKINGPIRLEKSLRPRIIAEDITLGNPPWATGAYFATAEKVGVQVALFPLLRGELRILDVAFSGVDLFIEKGPDDTNNYTFGGDGEDEAGRTLPQVERLQVKNSVINYRTADGGSLRFVIEEARLWNIPGEPERIEARGLAKGKTFDLMLAADNPAELSGPQNPWSMKLSVKGPDISLIVAGKMDHAFKWEQGDYHIKISGSQIDSLGILFGVQFPITGPFELSANVNKYDRSFRVTEIAARLQGLPETSVIKISNGEASIGQDDPLEIRLQGRLDDISFAFTLSSTQTLKGISQATAWPIEARLSIADAELNINGAILPETVPERFEFDAQLQGKTIKTLARTLNIKFPETGPYQLSFHSKIAARNISVTEIKGTIKRAGPWQMLGIDRGSASVNEEGLVEASLKTRLDEVSLSLVFSIGPGVPKKTGQKAWPLKLEASASGATFKGDGAVITTDKGKALQVATCISGNRFESLGPLLGISLPAIGKFNLSADVSSNGDLQEARNLEIQVRNNRISGNVRLEDKTPRKLLTGKLVSKRLTLSKFETPSKSSSKTITPGLMDRPIELDGLKVFDARLDIEIKSVADSPVPITDISSTVVVANGELRAPISGKAAGAPIDGQMHLRRRKNLPAVSLKMTMGQIDVGQTLKQLKLSDMITGTADAVNLDASSTGKTLRALLEKAAFTLQINPAKLAHTSKIADQAIDIQIESLTLVGRKDQPLKGLFNGTLRGTSFNAEVSTANIMEIQKADTSLPVQVMLQTEDAQFKAEGSIDRPIERNMFNLKYELTGKEIQGFDPLADFVVPLRGAFRAQGRITARGNRFTYEENLSVGESDLKVDITVLRDPPRPTISGSIIASQVYLEDVRLFKVDKVSEPVSGIVRVIPNFTLPINALLAADLYLDIKAERICSQWGELGEFVSKVSLKDGRFKSSVNVAGADGGRLNSEFDLDAAANPPLTKIQLNIKDLNHGFFLRRLDVTDLVYGKIDLLVDLSGTGASRYSFLENAAGRITIIGGPGQITGRRIDLWAADLLPTMLSPRWQRDDVTETNCIVAHIKLKEGLAEIEDLLLDTQRITIAGSGILDLRTEEIDIILAPRPKRASLVSLANPVRIQGALSEPEVSVTRILRGRQLATTGLLAGLINPAFLLFALSDIGTGQANPCDAAVEYAREVAGADQQ